MPTILLTLNDEEARALGDLSQRIHGAKAADMVTYVAHGLLTQGVTDHGLWLDEEEATLAEVERQVERDAEARRQKDEAQA